MLSLFLCINCSQKRTFANITIRYQIHVCKYRILICKHIRKQVDYYEQLCYTIRIE